MRARVVVARQGRVLRSWVLGDEVPVDVGLVERLARAQLVARRHGCVLRLESVADDLRRLLDLVGLRVEVGGEAERGEQRRVEEVVVPDDPVA